MKIYLQKYQGRHHADDAYHIVRIQRLMIQRHAKQTGCHHFERRDDGGLAALHILKPYGIADIGKRQRHYASDDNQRHLGRIFPMRCAMDAGWQMISVPMEEKMNVYTVTVRESYFPTSTLPKMLYRE